MAESFPGINLIERPTVLLPEKLDVHWFVGFIDAKGCFYINISKSVTTKLGYSLYFNFKITQHTRDVGLFKFINKWLGCGHVDETPKKDRVNFVITSLKDLVEILIPILNKYNLQWIKKLKYDNFMTIVKLVENKEHLNQ